MTPQKGFEKKKYLNIILSGIKMTEGGSVCPEATWSLGDTNTAPQRAPRPKATNPGFCHPSIRFPVRVASFRFPRGSADGGGTRGQ